MLMSAYNLRYTKNTMYSTMSSSQKRLKRTSNLNKIITYLDWLYGNFDITTPNKLSERLKLTEQPLTADDINRLTQLFELNDKEIANILQLF
jgi:hypothetical protein